MNLLGQHAQKFVPLKSSRSKVSLQSYKEAKQLSLDAVLANDQKPKVGPNGKPLLTKVDGTSEEIVTLYPGEHRPPKRW